MTNNAVERSLLESLHAYVKDFEIPNTREDLLAITSSILTFQQKQGEITISPNLIEPLIQNVVNQFNPDTLINSVVNSATEELVQEVNQWRQSLENQVLGSLNAFAQNFKPKGITNLPDTIVSIIPLVEDALLGKFQVNSLIQQVTSKFDFQTALGQVIGEEALAIAQKLADILQLEKLLQETILGNQPLPNQAIESITESFVNSELAKILGNDKFKFDIDLDSQQLMVKQVTLKFNILQSTPPPAKSPEEIAQQIDIEAEIFKVKQRAAIDALKNNKIPN